jgi:hypothetical protein
MATAAEILNDPNYVNANAATKKAIFDRRIAVLPEYRNANPATQTQIQTRFGISGQKMTGAKAAVSGFQQGIQTVGENLERFNPSRLLDIIPGVGAARRSLDVLAAPVTASQTATAQQAQQQRPNYFAGGKMASEIAATVPLIATGGGAVRAAGGGLARVAPRSGGVVQRVGEAITTGGIGAGRKAAQTAAMTRSARAGRLAERVAGGAIAGGAGAALTDQDVTTGAAFGGGLPVLASVLKRAGGAVPDLFKLPTLKAAEIIRTSLGENVEAARAAFAALPADSRELARQTLVKLGIDPRVFMAVAEGAERLRPDEVAGILGGQAAAREARLAAAGGGPTATATRSAAETGRRDVSRATGPMRETALERANIAGREVPQAEQLAAQARARAEQESGLARRMTFGAEKAETRLGQADDLGDVFDPAAVARERGLAGAMTQRGEQAALGAIGSRQVARDMEDYVADLAAQGMQPLQVSPIVQQLRSMAGQPGTRADELQSGALEKLADRLEGLANQNGVIDARDLYQIRKTGLNDIVDTLLSGRQPGSGTKERTASLLTSAREMIDNAIEGSGGAGWKDYLSLTRRGFEAVNRQELGGKAAQMAKESPNEFIALMRGERPKVVEDIMGTGQYDIGGMALADPQRYQGLTQSANELDVLNRMSSLAGEGRTAANELIGRERPRFARAATRLGLSAFPPARIAADAAQTAVTSALAPRVQQQLATGAMGGQNMLALMNQYPTSMQASEMISQLSPETRNALAQLLRSGTFKLNQPSE